MAIHGMIDLETLDTTPTSTILTLGAVKFDPLTADEPHSELYFKISIDEQDVLGRTVSESTIAWWSQQPPEIQAYAFSDENRVSIDEVLTALNKWLVGVDEIWGHGYGFDIGILENLYKMVGKPIPWNFWQISDSRTITKRMPQDPRKAMQSSLHNALADAYFQAKSVQQIFSHFGFTK